MEKQPQPLPIKADYICEQRALVPVRDARPTQARELIPARFPGAVCGWRESARERRLLHLEESSWPPQLCLCQHKQMYAHHSELETTRSPSKKSFSLTRIHFPLHNPSGISRPGVRIYAKKRYTCLREPSRGTTLQPPEFPGACWMEPHPQGSELSTNQQRAFEHLLCAPR